MSSQPTAQRCFVGRIDDLATTGTVTFDAWPDRSLLASIEAGCISWPSSCRNGTCRTCLGQLLAGHVHHTVAWPGLSSDELADGFTLPCVAQPLGDVHLRQAG